MRLGPDNQLPFDFWTADGWLWKDSGFGCPCEDAWQWYRTERDEVEWVDLGGEA